MEPNCAVCMNISFDYVPQWLYSRCCLIFTHPWSIFSFVYSTMHIKLFTVIIASPEICYYFSTFLNGVSYHLSTSNLCSIFHNKWPNILSPSFIKTKNPNLLFLTSFAIMSKFRFIYFNSSALLSKLYSTKMVLKISVDQ